MTLVRLSVRSSGGSRMSQGARGDDARSVRARGGGLVQGRGGASALAAAWRGDVRAIARLCRRTPGGPRRDRARRAVDEMWVAASASPRVRPPEQPATRRLDEPRSPERTLPPQRPAPSETGGFGRAGWVRVLANTGLMVTARRRRPVLSEPTRPAQAGGRPQPSHSERAHRMGGSGATAAVRWVGSACTGRTREAAGQREATGSSECWLRQVQSGTEACADVRRAPRSVDCDDSAGTSPGGLGGRRLGECGVAMETFGWPSGLLRVCVGGAFGSAGRAAAENLA